MLYIISTPIGNLSDITVRAVDTLKAVDLVLCEDTRRSSLLMKKLGISTRRTSFNDFNKERKTPKIISMLKDKDIALISDAGTPGISDPGFYLVREAIKHDITVTHIPGPSAIISALVVSGLPTDRFTFIGFLPKKKNKLRALKLEPDMTYVAFESPHRIIKTLNVIKEHYPEMRMALCRELTKLHEEVIRGNPAEILKQLKNPKGEMTLVMRIDRLLG